MSDNKYVLIASAGNSDIKFLVSLNDAQGKKNYKLVELAGAFNSDKETGLSIKQVHTLLLEKNTPYYFTSNLPDGTVKSKDKIRFFKEASGNFFNEVHWKSGGSIKNVSDPHIRVHSTVKTYGAINTSLYATKLDDLVRVLKSKHNNKEIEMVGGLFLGTDRGRAREPIASHILLAQWFANQFPHLQSAVEELPESEEYKGNASVFWCNMCKDIKDAKGKGGTDYEGKGKDYPVKRIIAKRIDDSVQYFLHMFNHPVDVLLSHTGGMGDLKSILTSSVKFRAQQLMLESHKTEESSVFSEKDFKTLLEERHLISRRESLDIRNQVEDRILQGDFLGAWANCVHLYTTTGTKDNDDLWVYAVLALKNYISGIETQEIFKEVLSRECSKALKANFKKLDLLLKQLTAHDDYKQQAQTLLTRHFFTVEAALQCSRLEEQQIKQALMVCAGISDQLFRACIFYYLDSGKEKFENKVINKLIFADDEVLKQPLEKVSNDEIEKQPFEKDLDYQKRLIKQKKDLDDQKRFKKQMLEAFNARTQWRNTLSKSGQSIALIYQGRISYGKNAKNPEDQWKLQQWRNSIAHGRNVNENDLKHILKKAVEASTGEFNNETITVESLWNPLLENNHNLGLGECFLSQHYVKEIEKSFKYKVGSSQEKYKALVGIVLKIVRSSLYNPEFKCG